MQTAQGSDVPRPARRSLLPSILACNLTAAALAFTFASAEAPPPQAVRRDVRGVATGTGTAFDVDLKATVEYLASDELEGRGLGTPGLDKAADYIADNFRKLGLKPPPGQDDYFQHFKMTTATRPGDGTALKFKAGDDDTAYGVDDDYTPLSFSGEKAFDGRV
jgi:hypothetical protein